MAPYFMRYCCSSCLKLVPRATFFYIWLHKYLLRWKYPSSTHRTFKTHFTFMTLLFIEHYFCVVCYFKIALPWMKYLYNAWMEKGKNRVFLKILAKYHPFYFWMSEIQWTQTIRRQLWEWYTNIFWFLCCFNFETLHKSVEFKPKLAKSQPVNHQGKSCPHSI